MARDPSATPQDDGFFTIFYGDIVMVEENNSSTPPPTEREKGEYGSWALQHSQLPERTNPNIEPIPETNPLLREAAWKAKSLKSPKPQPICEGGVNEDGLGEGEAVRDLKYVKSFVEHVQENGGWQEGKGKY